MGIVYHFELGKYSKKGSGFYRNTFDDKTGNGIVDGLRDIAGFVRDNKELISNVGTLVDAGSKMVNAAKAVKELNELKQVKQARNKTNKAIEKTELSEKVRDDIKNMSSRNKAGDGLEQF